MRHSRHTQTPADHPGRVAQSDLSSAAVELHLPARRAELGAARRCAHEAATAFGRGDDAAYECAFAGNKAVTTAIRHGTPDEHGMISVRFSSDADRLSCTVHDKGTFIVPPPRGHTRTEPGQL